MINSSRRSNSAVIPEEFCQPELRRPFTVYLIQYEQEIRESLARVLQGIGLEVREYMTAMEFYRDSRQDGAGVVLVDIRIPGVCGEGLHEKLRNDHSLLPVVAIAGHSNVPTAIRMVKNGAFDFLRKPIDADDLVSVIARVYCHCYGIENAIMDEQTEDVERSLNLLTGRERQILDLVIGGLSTKRISLELDISVKTVEAHRTQIKNKMRARDVAHLVRMCLGSTDAVGSV